MTEALFEPAMALALFRAAMYEGAKVKRCTMRPEPETNEMVVSSLHPGVTCQQVRENTGWEVRFAGDAGETEAPAPGELEVLRDLHARTARAHGAGREGE